MNGEAAARLRELARRYAEGQVSRDNYLAMRTAVLDAATGVSDRSGAEQRALRDAPAQGLGAQASAQDTTLTEMMGSERAAGDAGRALPEQAFRERHRLLMRAGLSGVVTAVILGTLWFALPDSPQDPELSTTPVPQTVDGELEASPSAEALVAGFMAQGDWSAGAMADFMVAWEQLPAAGRREALGAAWFKAFADELNERITEQQALAEIRGAGHGAGEYQALVEFAERLGLR